MQLTYSQKPDIAIAGLRSEGSKNEFIVSKICASGATISPGVALVENADGTVQAAGSAGARATASAALKLAGVSLYKPTNIQGLVTADPTTQLSSTGVVYVAGDEVPVMRNGRVWVNFVGTARGDLATANVVQASSGGASAAQDGFFTDAATSAGTGTEVAGTNCLFIGDTASGGTVPSSLTAGVGLALIEVHTP
jgi:hypothetical protein